MAAPKVTPFDPPVEAAIAANASRRVLDVGSGPEAASTLHPAFRRPGWAVTRLDLNPNVKPDIVGSIKDMRAVVADASFDSIWSSHILEHLNAFEVVPSLREFCRALKPDGFALVTCPDLEAICRLVLDPGLDVTVYDSPAGPITPLDMIYGHVRSVSEGNRFMRHHCGFTTSTLGRVALQAGFAEARVAAGGDYALWAIFMMPKADREAVTHVLRGTSEEYLVDL